MRSGGMIHPFYTGFRLLDLVSPRCRPPNLRKESVAPSQVESVILDCRFAFSKTWLTQRTAHQENHIPGVFRDFGIGLFSAPCGM